MKRAKLIIILVIVAVAGIVILQNTAAVETKMLWYSVTMPRALLLVVTALVGFAVGVITCMGLSNKR